MCVILQFASGLTNHNVLIMKYPMALHQLRKHIQHVSSLIRVNSVVLIPHHHKYSVFNFLSGVGSQIIMASLAKNGQMKSPFSLQSKMHLAVTSC
jgi:hypothetical protein